MWGSSSALQCRCGGGVNVGAHRLLPLHCHRSHHSGGGRDGSIQSRLCWDSGVVDVLSSSRGERSWETATASCNGEGQGERKKLLGGVKERLKKYFLSFLWTVHSAGTPTTVRAVPMKETSSFYNIGYRTKKVLFSNPWFLWVITIFSFSLPTLSFPPMGVRHELHRNWWFLPNGDFMVS